MLLVKNGSGDHSLDLFDFVGQSGLNIDSEGVESEDQVIVGIVGISDGIVSSLEDIVLLLADETDLVVEWSLDLLNVLVVDLLQTLESLLVHSVEVVDSSGVSNSDSGDEGVSEVGVVSHVLGGHVEVSLDTVIAVVVILIWVILEATVAIGVAVVTGGAEIDRLSRSSSNKSSESERLHCFLMFVSIYSNIIFDS